ncbi:nitrate reductase cytochrome c-type subunit [Luteimonas sp. SJ-92]|uniref:Periplasmic nitrate reductase, electron transfer subunit n=1 Tax=Luteimonas salinisoli TaxID=2752307 RepID=A0A853J8N2_9GAMM|nr:nitrate reductase cytochrome c-type subunit [Luteimonas salinisoli]NZA25546.1 nitrate reductase cytochrome c-type subunit [Luteimonas salinisoli]
MRPAALLLPILLLSACDWTPSKSEPEVAPPSPPISARGNPARDIDGMRRHVPIDVEVSPLPMARVENFDMRRGRAYPMQPPTIPHSIDGYQVDLNSNRCMLCHARSNAAQFQAPEVSVTHYMDRDDQFLATISTRRYFCLQCHVVQTDAQPLVGNEFVDIDTLLQQERRQ